MWKKSCFQFKYSKKSLRGCAFFNRKVQKLLLYLLESLQIVFIISNKGPPVMWDLFQVSLDRFNCILFHVLVQNTILITDVLSLKLKIKYFISNNIVNTTKYFLIPITQLRDFFLVTRTPGFLIEPRLLMCKFRQYTQTFPQTQICNAFISVKYPKTQRGAIYHVYVLNRILSNRHSEETKKPCS